MRVYLQLIAVFCLIGAPLLYATGRFTGEAALLVGGVGFAAFLLSGLFRR